MKTTFREISVEETFPIRKEVLRKGIDLPYKFEGDFDKHSFHLGAFNNGKLVSVATFMRKENRLISNDKQYQLRGMATLEEVRGLGFGSKILDKAFTILNKKGVQVLWCNAREVALNFYNRKGFVIIGDPFNIQYIGKHYILKRIL